MTYVDDVTEAFLAAAATPACHGRVFNIGGAPPASLTEIAEMMVAAGPGAHYVTREFPADRARIDIGSYHADDTFLSRRERLGAAGDAGGWHTPLAGLVPADGWRSICNTAEPGF